MKIAIPVYKNRVAPSFDYCKKVIVVTLESSKDTIKEEILLGNSNSLQKVIKLSYLKINVLICGAISEFAMRMLINNRISAFPCISGEIDETMELYIKGQLNIKGFRMRSGDFYRRFPGRRKGWRHRGASWYKNPREDDTN